MLFKKYGLPEEGELIFCTVTNVQYNSVFVKIEAYNKSGLIHISEISPGRIRNIRDYVKEGKMIVCKVIKVDSKSGNIDVSLRRVTEMQKRQKTDERKQEQKAENILESLAVELKRKPEELYLEVSKVLLPDYEMLQYAFEDVVENNVSLEKLGVNKTYAKKLEDSVREKIKPKSVSIQGVIRIKTYSEDGVGRVKKTLMDVEKVSKNASIKYLGAGNHSLIIDAKDYKEAEAILKSCIEVLNKEFDDDKNSEFIFERKDKKD
ncbi:S1 RNA-binding domain-containing protein [Candidatus Woesearchaeota archaeon]|nr:S1 RNA-binding domain-containing protein [Candidatus Woesearchaeota archaeon]MCF7901192.1 S1 RNA-binding domain-containing protein [Candidatus Woesearchaeota archaeon]MCF8013713.1 S1 RNA-binding domain-containing protein [Candidatus Woesearchaeota archaeon]